MPPSTRRGKYLWDYVLRLKLPNFGPRPLACATDTTLRGASVAMTYDFTALPEARIPRSSSPVFPHLLDTYASETNKVISVWRCFSDADLSFQPHPRSQPVVEVFKHQLLSERRFFGEFLSAPEPSAGEALPAAATVANFT